MSNNLKSLLRKAIDPAKANATKVWDIEKQRVCSANDTPNPLVIFCTVKDSLLYESFYQRESNQMVLKGITVYDKEHTQMQTIRLEDKIRFSVREFDLDSWFTTPRRYADDNQKNISAEYLGKSTISKRVVRTREQKPIRPSARQKLTKCLPLFSHLLRT